MFDLRYHVASLAAVFLALIIGILVGVGISDSGVVDSAKTKFLQDEVASLQRRLDNKSTQSADKARDRVVAQSFINETYPALAQNRLKGRHVAVVFVGSDEGASSAVDINSALTDAGAGQLRLRALKMPVDIPQLERALAKQPAAAGLRGRSNLEGLGRALGEELAQGGDTPLWNSLTEALVEHNVGGAKPPADGVVVVRTAPPQHGATTRLLLGLYEGLGSAGVPAVGVEQTHETSSATDIYREAGLSSVDDIDTRVGRLALILLLQGASPGQYGVKDSADDGALPPMPPTATPPGG